MEISELGLSQEELRELVVERISRQLLISTQVMTDEDGEEYPAEIATPFQKELRTLINDTVISKIGEIAEKQVVPEVGKLIDACVLQETNRWGEKIGTPLTFTEYLTKRAQEYMTEDVDYDGKSKAESRGFSWSKRQSRIAHMIQQHLHYHIETWAQNALAEANKTIVDGLQKTVETKLQEVLTKLKISVK